MSHKKITISTKRVCIINKETNMIMRVSREFAVNAVVRFPNIYRYTTKHALAKFMKRDVQLSKNERFIKAIETNKGHKYWGYKIRSFKSSTGRIYYIIGGGNHQSNQFGGVGQILVKIH